MFRLAAKLAPRSAGIYRYRPQAQYASRVMGTTLQKKGTTNRKYKTAYSKVTMEEAEKRLGFILINFEKRGIPASQMLAESKPEIEGLGEDEIQETKEKVYDRIIELIEVEGYPTEANEDFKEANVNDLVLAIIIPIIRAFKSKRGRDLLLQREKEIIAGDLKTGGYEEFVMVDIVGVGARKFVFLVEAKKSSLGEAKKQCLLAMKDMGNRNGGGVVYGFVTTGEQWQMLRYDNTGFTQTIKLLVLSEHMEQDKGSWMKGASIIVDCIHAALRSGGFVVT